MTTQGLIVIILFKIITQVGITNNLELGLV